MTENRGGAYRFRDEIIFCLTGADMKAELDGVIVEPYTPTIASPGAVLSLGEAKQGIRTYLLVAESLDMPLTLGSAATFTLGGYNNEWTIQIDPQKVKAVESTHGPAENMAPFLAYLSTDEANDINGAVFSVTGDARVMLYSEPLEVSTIKKSDESWSVEELIETVPKTLLKDYVSIVKSKNWEIVLAPDRWISLLSDR